MHPQKGGQTSIVGIQFGLGGSDLVLHGPNMCDMHILRSSANCTYSHVMPIRMTPSERLVSARKAAGYKSGRSASMAMGAVYDTYAQHENGTRPIARDPAVRYAKFYRVSLDWLLTGKGTMKGKEREALLVGKVGAGAEIHRFDHPDVLAGYPLPEGIEAPNVAEIEGDSQYPLRPGWLIFYGPENQGVDDGCMGELCVLQVVDGPTLLKTPKKGSKKGLFRLESWNAPPREDVKLAWCAPVKMILPR